MSLNTGDYSSFSGMLPVLLLCINRTNKLRGKHCMLKAFDSFACYCQTHGTSRKTSLSRKKSESRIDDSSGDTHYSLNSIIAMTT